MEPELRDDELRDERLRAEDRLEDREERPIDDRLLDELRDGEMLDLPLLREGALREKELLRDDVLRFMVLRLVEDRADGLYVLREDGVLNVDREELLRDGVLNRLDVEGRLKERVDVFRCVTLGFELEALPRSRDRVERLKVDVVDRFGVTLGFEPEMLLRSEDRVERLKVDVLDRVDSLRVDGVERTKDRVLRVSGLVSREMDVVDGDGFRKDDRVEEGLVDVRRSPGFTSRAESRVLVVREERNELVAFSLRPVASEIDPRDNGATVGRGVDEITRRSLGFDEPEMRSGVPSVRMKRLVSLRPRSARPTFACVVVSVSERTLARRRLASRPVEAMRVRKPRLSRGPPYSKRSRA